jgi:hypothetical protein
MPTLTIVENLTFAADSPLAEVDSHTYGWKVVDYTSLRRRTRVGENRPIPGSPGRLYVPREWDEQTVVLTFHINGRWDKDGTPYGDSVEGVDLNHQYLLDNIVNSLDLRAVSFEDRHGATFEGNVVVEDWEPSVDPSSGGDKIIAPLTLKIPAGWLTPAGS